MTTREEDAAMDACFQNGLAWAVSRWKDEVSLRPMINVHRRTLDDTWRQVIRYFGGDPVKLIGPDHDTLMMQAQEERAWRPCTCHPDDHPPRPCPRKYALSECRAADRLRTRGAGSTD